MNKTLNKRYAKGNIFQKKCFFNFWLGKIPLKLLAIIHLWREMLWSVDDKKILFPSKDLRHLIDQSDAVGWKWGNASVGWIWLDQIKERDFCFVLFYFSFVLWWFLFFLFFFLLGFSFISFCLPMCFYLFVLFLIAFICRSKICSSYIPLKRFFEKTKKGRLKAGLVLYLFITKTCVMLVFILHNRLER